MTTFVFTDEMSEISGFGLDTGYEKACRAMVVAGIEWLTAHPDADPKFHGFKGVYGYIVEDNDDAKALTQAVLKACPDCSGAMMQAVINHVFYARKNGVEAYRAMLLKPQEKAEG